MKYLYYPGCSLKSTGKPYEESLKAVFSSLDVGLEDCTTGTAAAPRPICP